MANPGGFPFCSACIRVNSCYMSEVARTKPFLQLNTSIPEQLAKCGRAIVLAYTNFWRRIGGKGGSILLHSCQGERHSSQGLSIFLHQRQRN
jgi:hypothetical protein